MQRFVFIFVFCVLLFVEPLVGLAVTICIILHQAHQLMLQHVRREHICVQALLTVELQEKDEELRRIGSLAASYYKEGLKWKNLATLSYGLSPSDSLLG